MNHKSLSLILFAATTVAQAAQQAPQKLVIPWKTPMTAHQTLHGQRSLLRRALSKEQKEELDSDLKIAVEKKDRFEVRYLLTLGANPNQRMHDTDRDSYVPLLHYASLYCNPGITQDLSDAGATK